MREDEVDSMAQADMEADEAMAAEEEAEAATKLIKVFEAIFESFQKSLSDAARHCRCSDASTALYEVDSAINMMDIPYTVRKTLGVLHG